jgi:hypothetical protein
MLRDQQEERKVLGRLARKESKGRENDGTSIYVTSMSFINDIRVRYNPCSVSLGGRTSVMWSGSVERHLS